MTMIKVGDLITRNSYNNDIVFKVINIRPDGYADLKGIVVRLIADGHISDFELITLRDIVRLGTLRNLAVAARSKR
jgi:spore coat assemly protein